MNFKQAAITKAVARTRALAHPLRMKILEYLDTNPGCPTNEIYHKLKIEQSICSKHLRILKNSDIIVPSKHGIYVAHYINYPIVNRVVTSINKFIGK